MQNPTPLHHLHHQVIHEVFLANPILNCCSSYQLTTCLSFFLCSPHHHLTCCVSYLSCLLTITLYKGQDLSFVAAVSGTMPGMSLRLPSLLSSRAQSLVTVQNTKESGEIKRKACPLSQMYMYSCLFNLSISGL